MTLSRLAVVPFLLSSLVLFACSSGGSENDSSSAPPAASAPDAGPGLVGARTAEGAAVDVCARTCARRVTCDPATDEDTCISKCKNADGSFLSKIRAEYAAEIATCIDNAACRKLDDGTAIRDCSAEARARLSPTVTATGFCDDYATAWSKCGGEIAKAACFNIMKTYSDASLSDASKCFAKKCADLEGCVAAALDFGTSNDAPPTTTPTTTTPPTTTPPTTTPPPSSCIASTFASPACGACVASACCAQQKTCESDASCKGYIACLRTCTTPACLTSCGTTYPTGPAASAAVQSCAKSSCPASCANW